MKFCCECGAPVSLKKPAGDDRSRYVCHQCQTVHYQNPKIVVGVLPVIGERILLCRRAIEPRHGYWTLPAGFMENQETLLAGARRETWEEARATVCDEQLYAVISVPDLDQVHVFFRARLARPDFAPGVESLDVCLFDHKDIPWQELAFTPVKRVLGLFVEDWARGHFPCREESIAGSWK